MKFKLKLFLPFFLCFVCLLSPFNLQLTYSATTLYSNAYLQSDFYVCQGAIFFPIFYYYSSSSWQNGGVVINLYTGQLYAWSNVEGWVGYVNIVFNPDDNFYYLAGFDGSNLWVSKGRYTGSGWADTGRNWWSGYGKCLAVARSNAGIYLLKFGGGSHYIFYGGNWTLKSVGSSFPAFERGVAVMNTVDKAILIQSDNTMYLFDAGAVYLIDQTFMFKPYTSSFKLYAVYNPKDNCIYLGWDYTDRYGWSKISVSQKKVVYQSYVLSLTKRYYLIGFDGDFDNFVFVYRTSTTPYGFAIYEVKENANAYSVNIDLAGVSGAPNSYWHGYLVTPQGAIYSTTRITEKVDYFIVRPYVYQVSSAISIPRYPLYGNDTITYTFTLTRSGVTVNKFGVFIYCNQTKTLWDTKGTVNGVLTYNYRLPYLSGYPNNATVKLTLYFFFIDIEVGSTKINANYNHTFTYLNAPSLEQVYVKTGYIFQVRLLTPTQEWKANYHYTFYIKLCNATTGNPIPKGMVMAFLNGETVKEISFHNITECQAEIVFPSVGDYILLWKALDDLVEVGRYVYYVKVKSVYTPPQQQPPAQQEISPLIPYAQFSSLLMVALLLFTPAFLLAYYIGGIGFFGGLVLGLVICVMANLIPSWSIVLLGLTLLAVMFFKFSVRGEE